MEVNERIQRVTFLRHGIAYHNLRNPVTNQPPRLDDPELIDPPLLLDGKYQAVQAGQELMAKLPAVDLIVASPLTRCLQTATLAFSSPFYDRPPPPIVCKEDVREAFGKHYPDQRRDKSLLQKHWPQVQFETTMTEFDILWNPNRREHLSDVTDRVATFLQWLVQLPQQDICVVSHGVFIECFLQHYAPHTLAGAAARVYNTDAYSCEIVSSKKNQSVWQVRNARQVRSTNTNSAGSPLGGGGG